MKKCLSVLLSVIMLASTISPCYTTIAAQVNKHSIGYFSDSVNEIIDTYDSDEDYIFDAESDQKIIKDRLIVSSDKVQNDYGAVDKVIGLGYTILQYETDELAETESSYNLTPNCYSTVTQNIDDAIRLMKKENISIATQNIGVIDTGISVNNITKNRLAGGYSYLDDHSSDGTQDEYGHGSSVAGVIINNTLDTVRLYSYQIEDTGQPSTISYAVSAIYLAISDNCKIANCSFVLGEAKESKTMIEAADYANSHGMIIVCAAGNDSKELSGYKYPAMLDDSIAVGAVTSNKRITSFSNFGNAVDIYADGYALNSYDQSGSSKFFTGTSAASPLVASICSLLLYAKPGITVKEVKQLLLETGYSTNDENISEKHRIIADAYACVKKLLGCELEQVNRSIAEILSTSKHIPNHSRIKGVLKTRKRIGQYSKA